MGIVTVDGADAVALAIGAGDAANAALAVALDVDALRGVAIDGGDAGIGDQLLRAVAEADLGNKAVGVQLVAAAVGRNQGVGAWHPRQACALVVEMAALTHQVFIGLGRFAAMGLQLPALGVAKRRVEQVRRARRWAQAFAARVQGKAEADEGSCGGVFTVAGLCRDGKVADLSGTGNSVETAGFCIVTRPFRQVGEADR